jgi:hypothetical protein
MCKRPNQKHTQPAAACNMKPTNPNVHSHVLDGCGPTRTQETESRRPVAAAACAVEDPRKKKDCNRVFDATEEWKLLFGVLCIRADDGSTTTAPATKNGTLDTTTFSQTSMTRTPNISHTHPSLNQTGPHEPTSPSPAINYRRCLTNCRVSRTLRWPSLLPCRNSRGSLTHQSSQESPGWLFPRHTITSTQVDPALPT